MDSTVKAQSPAAINSMLYGKSQIGLAFNDPVGTTKFIENGLGDPVSKDVYSIPMPGHAALSHLHFAASGNTLPGLVTVSVYVNSAPSMVSCTVAAQNMMRSDTTNSITVNEGDFVTIGMTSTNVPSATSGSIGPFWRASVGIAFQ